jgi:hypothetical protein
MSNKIQITIQIYTQILKRFNIFNHNTILKHHIIYIILFIDIIFILSLLIDSLLLDVHVDIAIISFKSSFELPWYNILQYHLHTGNADHLFWETWCRWCTVRTESVSKTLPCGSPLLTVCTWLWAPTIQTNCCRPFNVQVCLEPVFYGVTVSKIFCKS